METSLVLRPVQQSDYDSLRALVSNISGGLTSLPDHPDYLLQRIHDSCRSFDHRVNRPGSEVYLFVLENTKTGKLIGTSGLLARVGGFDPFYTYRISSILKEYPPLNVSRQIRILELTKNHKGPSEICSLYLHPDYRRGGIGKLLSRSRFCFMKAFPERFDTIILAELRGYLDSRGRSPFWEAVGNNFFWQDYYEADVLSGIGEKDFIDALMPEYPIYIELLPQAAQKKIGAVHPQTEPAKTILLQEGFKETDEVDIFDAGPILRTHREKLRSWRECRQLPASVQSDAILDPQPALVTNNRLDFRATLARVHISKSEKVLLGEDTAALLSVKDGDVIQVLPKSI